MTDETENAPAPAAKRGRPPGRRRNVIRPKLEKRAEAIRPDPRQDSVLEAERYAR
jgi:hypothetical protein